MANNAVDMFHLLKTPTFKLTHIMHYISSLQGNSSTTSVIQAFILEINIFLSLFPVDYKNIKQKNVILFSMFCVCVNTAMNEDAVGDYMVYYSAGRRDKSLIFDITRM